MKPEYVSKSQFKAKALHYFRQIEATGKTVIVTDYGRPTIEIRPYWADPRSPLEKLRGSLVDYEAPTEPVAEDDWEEGT